MILNSFVNYGGRLSRLCFNIPLLVHTALMYIVYHMYHNLSLYNISILFFLFILVNIEWIIVIVYEYIYLYNYNVNNNLLYNIILFIFLEIVLFIGIYWMYLNFVINSSNSSCFSASNLYTFSLHNNNTFLHTFICSNSNCNYDIMLYIVISNLLILLYVTLILQYIHIYLQI